MTSILEGLVLDGLDLNSVPSASSAYQTAALALGPSLYWRHGESVGTTATDTSGNSRTGTYVSGITVNQTGLLTGDADKAITGDGTTNSKVTSTYNPFTGNLTVCGWANATTLAAARNLFGGSAAGGPLLQIETTGEVDWFSDLGAAAVLWSAGTWTAATRIFWALTWNNSTKTSELFLNGVSQGTKVSANAFNATPGNFTLAGSGASNGFLGTMDETLVLAGTILSGAQITALYNAGSVASTASAFRLQGYDVTPPPKRQEWAQGADIDGALLVRDPLFDNREITLRLRVSQQTTMDLALAQIATLSKKLEEAEQQADGLALVWTPAGSANSITFYVLSGTVEGLPIDLSGDDAGWFLRSPVITVKLICKPFGYGTPVTSSTASSATPFVTMTIAAQPGDVPAEGRLLVLDAASQNRRYVEWGLEQRYYNAATSLLVDSDDMVTTGFSGAQTTRTGAYDPNAAGNSVVRGTLTAAPLAVCGTGNLSHVGTYRVKARIYASTTSILDDFTLLNVRLAWQEGDGSFRANAWTQPVIKEAFCEVDLGVVTIPPAQLGTQRWTGRIEAYTTNRPGSDTLDIDYLVLVPAGEGYGRVRGQIVADTPTVLSARDEFDQTAGALVGKTAPVGGVWAGGGDADDFQVEATGHTASRAVALDGDARGRLDWAPTSMTATAVQVDFKTSSYGAGTIELGVVARVVDANNFFMGRVSLNAGGICVLRAGKCIAGVFTVLRGPVIPQPSFDTWYTIRLVIDAAGRFWVGYAPKGSPINLGVSGQDAVLATGGTLQSGFVGIHDNNLTAITPTRNYDNFMAWVPAVPTVLYSGRTAEIRYDGAIRQDSTGTYYGPVPSYRGSRFLVPPAGDENRPSRILAKAHRGDIEAELSDVVTDNLTIQTIVTPRYVVVPF